MNSDAEDGASRVPFPEASAPLASLPGLCVVYVPAVFNGASQAGVGARLLLSPALEWQTGAGGIGGPDPGILQSPPPKPLCLLSSAADVKFISNPPSMVAAGSVVAAVQGLHLGSSNSFLSYHRLTRFLSRVIRCDPVSDRAPASRCF